MHFAFWQSSASGDISWSLLVKLSRTDESWEGRHAHTHTHTDIYITHD